MVFLRRSAIDLGSDRDWSGDDLDHSDGGLSGVEYHFLLAEFSISD